MKYSILAATGQIGQMTTQYLLDNTDADLVLFGHRANQRLAKFAGPRVEMVDGDLTDTDDLTQAIKGSDGVFVAFVATPEIARPLIQVMDEQKVSRLVVMSVPDIYQEVAGPFQQWYREHTGLTWQTPLVEAADLFEASDLDYVILRTTWLYNDANNTKIDVSPKGQPFKEAQITREAVAKFAAELLTGDADYHQANLGIGEPGTEWRKPSFY